MTFTSGLGILTLDLNTICMREDNGEGHSAPERTIGCIGKAAVSLPL